MVRVQLHFLKRFSPKLLVFVSILFATSVHAAADGGLPEFQSQFDDASKVEQQGLAPKLSAEQLKAYDSWVDVAVEDLKNAQLAARSIVDPNLERDFWVNKIKKVVPQSSFEKDTLFRWALNRALKIEETLEHAKSAGQPANVDQENRVLRRSVEIALLYADQTFTKNQDAISELPFQEFAVAEADALLWIDENELDTEAQREIGLEVLGWMHVDLWRDSQSKLMAHPIGKIADLLKKSDEKPHSVSMEDIRGAYFDALNDLKNGGSRVGGEIKQFLLIGKTTKVTKRVHL